MPKEYWTISEVIEIFQVEERFIEDLEEEEILCPTCLEGMAIKQFSAHDMERLRLAKNPHGGYGCESAGGRSHPSDEGKYDPYAKAV